jgi:hypothetical protein
MPICTSEQSTTESDDAHVPQHIWVPMIRIWKIAQSHTQFGGSPKHKRALPHDIIRGDYMQALACHYLPTETGIDRSLTESINVFANTCGGNLCESWMRFLSGTMS